MTATSPTSLQLAPQPDLHVALLALHAQAGDDFFSDTALAWAGGELRQLGLRVSLVHVHLPRGNQAGAQEVYQDLLRWVAAERVGLVAVDQLWDEGLVGALQREGALVACLDPNAVFASAEPDFVLAHVQTHRAPLRQLALAVWQGRDLLAVPNLRVRQGATWLPSREADQPWPLDSEATAPFCPMTEPVRFGRWQNADGSRPAVRRFLDTNTGCPYSEPIAKNRQFDDVELPLADITRKGCSFCFMGGDYRALPVGRTIEVQLAQIQFWQQAVAELEEVVLRDQAALRYLPRLIEACVAAPVRPLRILVPGRGEAILRYGNELRAAVALAESAGLSVGIHLIGFESFSQSQLDLYNKGVTVAEYAEALRQMHALHQHHPKAFALYASGASSFILFNPWTTLDDLQQTADFCTDHALGPLAQSLTLARLRLYPNLPLYWKAKRDGLLSAEPPPLDRGARFTGYSAEATWRYRDPLVAVVEDLQRLLQQRAKPAEGVGVLQAVLHWARGQGDVARAAGQLDAVVEGWEALRSVWSRAGSRTGSGCGERKSAPAATSGELAALARPSVSGSGSNVFLSGTTCNNRCRTCVADHALFLPPQPEALASLRARPATAPAPILAGREPTLWPQLAEVLKAAGRASMLSNGRALSLPGRLERLRRAGVQHLLLKRHRLHDADEDAYCQAEGAGAQQRATVQALAQLGDAGRWTLVLVAVREALGEWHALVEEAAEQGAIAVQFTVRAAEIDLAALGATRTALLHAAQTAEAHGLRVNWEGF